MAVILEIQSAALPNQEGCSGRKAGGWAPRGEVACAQRHRSLEVLSITSAGVGGSGLVTTKAILETGIPELDQIFPKGQWSRKGGKEEQQSLMLGLRV